MTKVKEMLAQEAVAEEKKAKMAEVYELEIDKIFGDPSTSEKDKVLLFLRSTIFETISGTVEGGDLGAIRDTIVAKVEAIEFTNIAEFRKKVFSAVLRAIADWVDNQGGIKDGSTGR
jgi:hypothetical protein